MGLYVDACSCVNTTPTVVLDALFSMQNDLVKSSRARLGWLHNAAHREHKE